MIMTSLGKYKRRDEILYWFPKVAVIIPSLFVGAWCSSHHMSGSLIILFPLKMGDLWDKCEVEVPCWDF